jgi:ATP-dependent DNA helicase RecG
VNGCAVLAVIVQPSDNPPVRVEGRAWIRVGPRRAIATPEEERRLVEKRRWGNLPFDAHGVQGASLDDLDLRRFELELLPAVMPPDVLAQNNRNQEQQLRALRLINAQRLPTVAGILFDGVSPQSFFPGAYVQFLRIDGKSMGADPISDRHEITGALQDQINRIDDLLAINIRNASVVGGAKRNDQPDYPIEALRQLVRNALMHRTYEGSNAPVRVTWYSDRIEIQSPGGPFGQVTVQNFEHGGLTDYRNPTIAEFMKSLGFVERFGVGLQIARAQLAANGNPPLEFEVSPQHVLAIVRARP